MDKAHAELLELLGQKRAHEQALEEVRRELALMDLRLEVQLALMGLIDSQIKPPG